MSHCVTLFIYTSISTYEFEAAQNAQVQINYVGMQKMLQ